MGLARLLLKLAVALVVLLLVAVGFAYATDMKVKADVADRQCDPLGESTVTVRARLLGVTHTAPVEYQVCTILRDESFVEYRLRSGRASLYDVEGGRCLFDTAYPPTGCDR